MRNSLRFSPKNLQHEFSSHAADFGIMGNWNKSNAALFRQAIEGHVASAPLVIPGTFRGVVSATHYFDPATRLWAGFDQSNMFIAGWKLYPSQVVNLRIRGDVT